jgi:hypothetical protein
MNSEQGPGGRTQGPAGAGEQVYQGLRAQILGLDPATAGLRQGSVDRVIWGALMETGYRRGTATLVALADGTTSLYLSGGGGIIGGGSHEAVATATKEYLAELEIHPSADTISFGRRREVVFFTRRVPFELVRTGP